MNVDEECQNLWGSRSLSINLPAVNINFIGLSDQQHETLCKSYLNFTQPKGETSGIECCVFRLDCLPEISPSELSLKGLYAPKKVRNKDLDYLSITGANFEARLTLASPGISTLGVVNEKELAHANVIENFLRIVSAHKVLEQKGVVLHSAGLVFDENAYIFSGRSNAGKTTLTRKAYAKGARVLSDDINLVLPSSTGYDAHAVPFTGEFGRTLDHDGGKESYPLSGIILLEQGEQLQTLPVAKSIAVARLLTGCPFVNTDEYESSALFDSVTGLVEKVPVIRMLNRRDNSIDDIMAAVKKQFLEL